MTATTIKISAAPQQGAKPSIRVVMAHEELPTSGLSVYLAGPTMLTADRTPWRQEAVEELAAQWGGPGELTVPFPEARDGIRADHYTDRVGWETAARATASVILFWMFRDVFVMPGFTANVEFGLDINTGRAVLGCPPKCPNSKLNKYLIYVAERHGVPVCETLPDVVAAALAALNADASREVRP